MTETELEVIEARCKKATAQPWRAMVEGRDHFSGDTFISTGGEDIYLSGATIEDHDFIAAARQDVIRLVEEVRRLRSLAR